MEFNLINNRSLPSSISGRGSNIFSKKLKKMLDKK